MTPRLDAHGWALPSAVRDRLEQHWRSGALLRALHAVPDPPLFPVRVGLPRPTGTQIADDLPAATAWARRIRAESVRAGWRLETRSVRAGVLGRQEIPFAGWVDGPAQALRLLGGAAATTAAAYAAALAAADGYGGWARQVALDRPWDVLDAGADWVPLLAVTAWLAAHPWSGVHPRAIPVPGAHTKLIETRRALLTRLLDAALPPSAVEPGAQSFAERYGLAGAARDVVLRGAGAIFGLDHLPTAQVTWPLPGLAGIDPAPRGVRSLVVVENRLSVRSVPVASGRLVLWGAGYGAGDLLAAVPWLPDVAVCYWGDLDTHGFAILAGVRAVAPHTTSVLMNPTTLQSHLPWATTESAPRTDDLPELTPAERETYDLLRNDTYRPGLRVEQEHIQSQQVLAAFAEQPADRPDVGAGG